MFNSVCKAIDKLFEKSRLAKQDRFDGIKVSNDRFGESMKQLELYHIVMATRARYFNKHRLALPKTRKDGRFITPKILYVERTDTAIVVKLSRSKQIVILGNGTRHFKGQEL